MTERTKIRGRWWTAIDATEVQAGDVVEYSTAIVVGGQNIIDRSKTGERRTHRVEAIRRGEFKPELHRHENPPRRRWWELRSIIRAWRHP